MRFLSPKNDHVSVFSTFLKFKKCSNMFLILHEIMPQTINSNLIFWILSPKNDYFSVVSIFFENSLHFRTIFLCTKLCRRKLVAI